MLDIPSDLLPAGSSIPFHWAVRTSSAARTLLTDYGATLLRHGMRHAA